MIRKINILTLTCAFAAAWLLTAQPVSAQNRQAQVVDVARQMRLKLRLAKEANDESLATSINRQEWDRLTPDERDKYRREALAFLNKTPEEQEKLLRHYEQLIKLSADKREVYLKRAQWLQVVVDSFSAEERKELAATSPQERASRLLDRKAQLIREGRLPADAPTTNPATTTVTPN